jgi:catechol O-methyltransferase
VIVGPSDAGLTRLHANGTISKIDLMFLDHYKPAYTSDLKLCERLGLVGPGSVLAADNVIKPGNPPYLAYVRSSVAEKKAAKGSGVEGFADRTAKQYLKREGEEKINEEQGDPNLVYESKLVHSFEPTGVPVSMPIPPLTLTDNCRMLLRLQDVQAAKNKSSVSTAIELTLSIPSIPLFHIAEV